MPAPPTSWRHLSTRRFVAHSWAAAWVGLGGLLLWTAAESVDKSSWVLPVTTTLLGDLPTDSAPAHSGDDYGGWSFAIFSAQAPSSHAADLPNERSIEPQATRHVGLVDEGVGVVIGVLISVVDVLHQVAGAPARAPSEITEAIVRPLSTLEPQRVASAPRSGLQGRSQDEP